MTTRNETILDYAEVGDNTLDVYDLDDHRSLVVSTGNGMTYIGAWLVDYDGNDHHLGTVIRDAAPADRDERVAAFDGIANGYLTTV